jgi:hypothetical protein
MRVLSVFLLFLSLSCTTFNDQSRRVMIKKEDVPFQARKSGFSEPRMRILVLPVLDVEKASSPNVATYARDVLVRNLVMTDQFIVLQNEDFPRDINSYLSGDSYDLEKLAKDAKGIGVSAVLEAKILRIKANKIGDEVGLIRKVKARMDTTIAVRMLGTDTQKPLLSETRSAVVEDSATRFAQGISSDRFLRDDPQLVMLSVSRAFESLIPSIIKSAQKMSWEGRIAKIIGEQVYLNAGRVSGLQVGDILKVVDTGQDIYDPESGEFLGHAPGRMKGTLEVISYFGKDGAIAVIHSGGGFQSLDRVEVY